MSRISSMTDYGRYGTVGLELIITLGVGYYGGHWLDEKFQTHGILTVVGIVFGVVAAIRQLVKITAQLKKAADRDEAYDREHGIVLPTFLKKDEAVRGRDDEDWVYKEQHSDARDEDPPSGTS